MSAASFGSGLKRVFDNRGRSHATGSPSDSRSRSQSAFAAAQVSERARSRSRDASRSEWGGEPLDAHSQASSFAGTSVYFLPRTHSNPWLDEEYRTYVSEGEYGPGRKFARLNRGLMKTQPRQAGKTHVPHPCVWIAGADNLWVPVPMDRWTNQTLQPSFVTDLDSLLAALKFEHRSSSEVHEADPSPVSKAIVAAWGRAVGLATTVLQTLSKLTPVRNVANIVATELEDPAFFERLDARRDILSFQNGVVDLRALAGGARLRTAEDCLSYALPYDYDPDADTSDIRAFLEAAMSSEEARRALQAHVGYWASGATTMKRFYQLSTKPNSGKTTFLDILTLALGKYVSNGVVPVAEMLVDSEFESTLSIALSQHPPPRVIVFDETAAGTQLNEPGMNLATSGSADIRMACRIKHHAAEAVHSLHAKFVFSSNHPLVIPSASSGTAFRNTAPPFDAQFVSPEMYTAGVSPASWKPRDDALCARLKSDAGRPGVAAWIVEGARTFFSTGVPRSAAWDRYSFILLTRGDAFVRWLSENYLPTGNSVDRVSVSALLARYSQGRPVSKATEDNIKAALLSLSDVVEPVDWEELAPWYGSEAPPPDHPRTYIQGYAGLRLRRLDDLPYFDAVEVARSVKFGAAD